MKKRLSIGQAAKLLGVSRQTLRRWDKSARFLALRKNKENNYHYYDQETIEEFSKTLDNFKMAKKWMGNKEGFEPLACYYCPDSDIFRMRLSRLQKELSEKKELENFFPSIVAIAGEIGNNSFDHNLGNWPDISGIFFSYNPNEIVLADRGQGILKTLKVVRPKLKKDTQALKMAFTETISGRFPENRGNGLKYVRKTVQKNNIDLFFQTGDAQLELKEKSKDLKIESSKIALRGCLVKIKF